MKKKRFPLSIALFLPIVLGVAVVSTFGFLGAYYSVRQADREDCSSTDQDFLASMTTGFIFRSPDAIVEKFKQEYFSNVPATFPATADEEKAYRYRYTSLTETQEFADAYQIIAIDMHTSYPVS